MSLRAIAVISIAESKTLIFKTFPTVEQRWSKSTKNAVPLPSRQHFVESLFKELGLANSGEFHASRDNCTKRIQVPLFWVPHDTTSSSFWPVVVVEKNGLLFCAVPLLTTDVDKKQPDLIDNINVTIAFEVLEKLLPFSALPHSELIETMSSYIGQWLPFGRPKAVPAVEHENLASRRSWLRSRPQLNVVIKEEIRAVIGTYNSTVELSGTVDFLNEANVDLNSSEFALFFSQLPAESRVEVLTHHSVTSPKSPAVKRYLIVDGRDACFPACSYHAALTSAPIGAVYKTRVSGLLLSLFIQLNFASLGNFIPSTLEVRLNLPHDVKVARTLSVNNQNTGVVAFPRDGAQIHWNLNPALTGTKLKGDVILTIEAELNKVPASPSAFANTFASVNFGSEQMTFSGLTVTFPGNTKFKPVIGQKVRAMVYKVWNAEATETY